jgi:hypothetical protein
MRTRGGEEEEEEEKRRSFFNFNDTVGDRGCVYRYGR